MRLYAVVNSGVGPHTPYFSLNTVSVLYTTVYVQKSGDKAVFVNVYGAQESIPRNRFQGIDSKESIQPAYVAWRAGASNRIVVPACQAGNRFLGSLKGLQIRALESCL